MMTKKRVLIIEDDKDISELIAINLTREGYDVSQVYDGGLALEFIKKVKPDLIALDLMLPNLDGFEICRLIKADDGLKSIPILMLTAKAEEADMIVGLQLGADDYVGKPFSPRVFLARVKALLRRTTEKTTASLDTLRQYSILSIDLIKHKVLVNKETIDLTSIEFDILEFLSRSPGRVYSREQILDNVWKEGKFIIDRTVDVHVRGLRKKLGLAQDYIETVRSVGYRFKDVE